MRLSLPTPEAPTPVAVAGILVAVEGAISVVVAVVLVVRGLAGADQSIANGFGSAVWFGVLGAAVVAGGVALVLGHRWGRAIAIVAQLLLLPVVWSLLTDSERPLWGSVLGVVVLTVLGCLFSGPANRWIADEYVEPE
ncbi:MAG: hypothetical protein WBF79_15435 [Rhodococcus sp. (in: high G+C Gram-positive bacteria)]